jgi:hypothetical protein
MIDSSTPGGGDCHNVPGAFEKRSTVTPSRASPSTSVRSSRRATTWRPMPPPRSKQGAVSAQPENAVAAQRRAFPRCAGRGRRRQCRRVVDLVGGPAEAMADEVTERAGHRLGDQVIARSRRLRVSLLQLAHRPHRVTHELLRAARRFDHRRARFKLPPGNIVLGNNKAERGGKGRFGRTQREADRRISVTSRSPGRASARSQSPCVKRCHRPKRSLATGVSGSSSRGSLPTPKAQEQGNP